MKGKRASAGRGPAAAAEPVRAADLPSATASSSRDPRARPPSNSAPRPSRLRVRPGLPTRSEAQDQRLARLVAAWFERNARDLPWRTDPRDPYHSLVAEAMLQQTQVARVVDRYRAFIERFPTARDLAAADEGEVLALWSGLGYYRRARNLHAAAKVLVAEHGARVPRDPAAILALPGVGRYTAGAVASIALGLPEPIVDGNVARVMIRVHGVDAATSDPAVQPWLWERAAAVARAAESPALTNEGVMELGATVCTPPPAAPRCPVCPLRTLCRARIEGRQLEIPRPKPAPNRRDAFCAVALVDDAAGRVLVERRGERGMWAGMWQAPTLESAEAMPRHDDLAAAIGLPAAALAPDGQFEFHATHRRMLFAVYRARAPRGYNPPRGKWVARAELEALPVSSPQRRVLLGEGAGRSGGAGGGRDGGGLFDPAR